MNVLVLLSGSSQSFKDAGFIYPKNLTEMAGKPLIQHVMQSLAPLKKSNANFICTLRQDENQAQHTGKVLQLMDPDIRVLEITGNTSGAACSALIAVDHIDNDSPLVITNGDQILQDIDIPKVVQTFRKNDWDAGVIVFEDIHPRWSFVKCDEKGMVIEAAEKRPISKYATAGFYYFKQGRDFIAAAKEMIKKDAHLNGLFYICPAINEMVLRQAKVGIYQIERTNYRSLATPADVQSYSLFLNSKP